MSLFPGQAHSFSKTYLFHEPLDDALYVMRGFQMG
jgi:hypothetical protein